MRFVILLILAILKICTSSVLFRIKSTNENISIDSSYLLGTIHVAQNLVWPYLSNRTLEILNGCDQLWMEQDFTVPEISKYIYECSIDKMSIKQRARLRAKSWSRFLNETKENSNNKTIKSNNLEKWRQWFANNEFLSNNYLWRNKTITNDTIFDNRILLEAYQRGTYVGSLESISNDCFSTENSKTHKKSSVSNYDIILSRVYNCDMVDEEFIKEIYKNLDFDKTKKRNKQITEHIYKLLKNNSQQKYLFVIGSAHLFGNLSIIQMFQDQFNDDYYIEQIDSPSPNFPYQNCTDEEFLRLADQTNSIQNKTITKRFLQYHLLN